MPYSCLYAKQAIKIQNFLIQRKICYITHP